MSKVTSKSLVILSLICVAAWCVPVLAQVEPDRAGVGQREVKLPEIPQILRLANELPAPALARAQADLAALGLGSNDGRIDFRSERWGTLILSRPMVPGRGLGNTLTWGNGRPPENDAALGEAAWTAFRNFLVAQAAQLRIDVSELAPRGRVTVSSDGEVIQIFGQRYYNGFPVRDSFVSAVVNNGNLTLFGAHQWGPMNAPRNPALSADDALAAVQAHVNPYPVVSEWGKPELVIVALARGRGAAEVEYGRGYDYRLTWAIRPSFENDLRRYEALVDAQTGSLISFEDTNQYAQARQVKGGVYPETNDGSGPEGVEQAGWPMPFAFVTNGGNTFTTDPGGSLLQCVDGSVTSQLRGPYMLMNDTCGSISLSSSGDLNFGTSGGTNCTTPGIGGAGNTHASRSGFYEMNRIKEMARGQLPNNGWLNAQLQANMNINSTCNAFWNGSVNFYRSGGGCNNTGELAGVFDHEWGHGMDANDATPGISNPGEGIADIYAALRLNTSCIGRGFRLGTNCGGYGDPCTSCDGVRDIDWAKRASGQPHTFTWANSTCGGGVHCRGYVYSEAVWDLLKRDLPAAPFNLDSNTAMEIVTRLTYIGAGGVSSWYSGSPPYGGCSASGGYLQYLAADDDNGNLNDGTPHMGAIYAAFNRHQIACSTPTVQTSGCAGTPATAPTVTATPLDRGAELSWNTVSGATGYEVFRTDGVFACDFGKTKVAETSGTSFFDSGLQNGRQYSYVVIPKGPADSCFGRASTCTSVTPAAGPNLLLDEGSVGIVFNSGDADPYIDNCESATVSFDLINVGAGSATNVRIVDVRAVSHPLTTIDAVFPSGSSPLTLATCNIGLGEFDFTGGELSFGDTVVFEIDYTSDELHPLVKTATLSFDNAESDLQLIPSQTWDFESDLDGWTLIQGTFNRATSGGGAGGSSAYVASSANLDNQCDQIRSPDFRLTATSTLSIQTNYDIENFSGGSWWDRANVAIYENGGRSLVTPTSGRLYNASGGGAVCVTTGQAGWAASAPSWAASGWTASDLNASGRAGSTVQLDIAYGTDVSVVGRGFWFDKVTVTNVEALVADGQSDVCSGGPFCGDGTCDFGEDQCSCASDCGQPASSEVNLCGDGFDNDCDGFADCADSECSGLFECTCGDGVCGPGEDQCVCAIDCGNPPTSEQLCSDLTDNDCDGAVDCFDLDCSDLLECTCGNEVCDPGEDQCLCADDCGTPPTSEGICDDSTDNDCDGLVDCADAEDCSANGACICDNDGLCETGEDCVNCTNDCVGGESSGGVCGNGVCEAGNGEDCVSCPADCNGVQNGKPSGRFCCGGGGGANPLPCSDPVCSTGAYSCTDTPQPGGSYCCGDLTCGGDENCGNCALDCTLQAAETGYCEDAIDNDCDFSVDCSDSDCSGDPACEAPPPAVCSDISDKNTCNAQPNCRWDNRNKVCISR